MEVDLKFHPDAEMQFEIDIQEIFNLVTKSTMKQKNNQDTFKPIHHAKTIKYDDIIDFDLCKVDINGNITTKYFKKGDEEFELSEQGCNLIAKLSEKIGKLKPFHKYLSRKTVEKYIYLWINNKLNEKTTLTFCNYILKNCTEEIHEQEIWTPIAFLSIQTDIEFGKVKIINITKEVIERWEKNSESDLSRLFSQIKQKFQGYSSGYINLFADNIKAKEIALEETDRSISLLRLFSPAILSPLMSCNIALKGNDFRLSNTTLIINENTLESYNEEFIHNNNLPLLLDNKTLKNMNVILCKLSEILQNTNKSEFNIKLFECLMIYSKVPNSRSLSEKTLYLFTSIEGIILKDKNEPILQNLSDRIAIYIGNTIEDKKEIIKHVKKLYDIRSSFIHHAESIDDVETLAKVMFHAFNFFTKLILEKDKFKTKLDFISSIDDKKLS